MRAPAPAAPTLRRWWRYAWALPCTALGLLAAAPLCLAGATVRRHSGVLEVAFHRAGHPVARALARLPFAGITFGHVVLAVTHASQAALRVHERVHVAQYERWGPLFLLAYPASSLVQWLRGGRPYTDNRFERQARAAEALAAAGPPAQPWKKEPT